MDQKVLDEWSKHYDEKFEREHPQFMAWYKTTNDYRQECPARVAWKSAYTQQQYLEAKQYGLTENTTSTV
jgi:hypothetical protein